MDIVVDDKPVFATTAGGDLEGDGPAVILLHGAGMDRSVWQLQTRYLSAHGLRALAVDLPGHGRSEGPALESIPELADWVAALIPAAGFASAHLVGHSMGALMALETAARHPAVVASITMIGIAAAMPVHPDLQAAADVGDPLAAGLMTSWAHGRSAHAGQSPAPGLWLMGGTNVLIRSTPDGSLGRDLAACAAYAGAVDAAGAITCPATFVLGRQDKMTPVRAAQELLAALPDATVHHLAGGHMLMNEHPIDVRRAIMGAVGRA